ncbi:hypothetical protein Tco_1072210, partial [Tanacetum coccineum]
GGLIIVAVIALCRNYGVQDIKTVVRRIGVLKLEFEGDHTSLLKSLTAIGMKQSIAE